MQTLHNKILQYINATSIIVLRSCSTNYSWIHKHLNKITVEKSWRENPNDTSSVPIKRGDIYYKPRRIPPYPYKRRSGYKINWFNGGFLPRVKTETPAPIPPCKPSDSWTHEKAYFGQNDYIDILGDGIKLPDLIDKGPLWVRGVPKKWNELQWLIRKNNYMGEAMKTEMPERYRLMKTRLKHLYFYYNVKLAGREGKPRK